MVETTEVAEDVYMVDTMSYGHQGHTAAFVVDAERPAVVETGLSTTVDRVLAAVEDVVGRDAVEYVIPTHVHLDHAGGAGYLLKELSNASLVVHENGYPYVTDPGKTEKLVESVHRAVGELADEYGGARAVDPDRARAVEDGDTVDLGSRGLAVVDAPGHAPHQFVLQDSLSDAVFAADAAGMYLQETLHRTTPPPNFDLEDSVETLRSIRELEPSKLVYTHYGTRDDVDGALDEYENTLQNWVKEVKQAVADEGSGDSAVDALVEDADHDSYPRDWTEVDVRETVRMDAEGVLLYLD